MIKLELSDQTVQTIGQLLEQAPYKIAAPILLDMQKQINDQQDKPVKVDKK